MSLTATLTTAILPLYLMIALGYIAGRVLQISAQQVSGIVIYIIVPVVFFGAVATTRFDPAYFLLPAVAFGLSACMATLMYGLSRRLFQDSTANLIGQASCTGNTGYFGVPLFLSLQPESTLGVYLLAIIGISISEATIGYYIIARGQFTAREALGKLLRLPLLYACAAGLAANALVPVWPESVLKTLQQFRGAYVVLGMMMIGLGLSTLHRLEVNLRFLTVLLVEKFIVWPLLALGVIALDHLGPQWLDPLAVQVILTFSVVPLAANTVAFAAQLRVHPEKAAAAVLISTVLALGYMPVVFGLFERSGLIVMQ
jgi:malate permease and related proteins